MVLLDLIDSDVEKLSSRDGEVAENDYNDLFFLCKNILKSEIKVFIIEISRIKVLKKADFCMDKRFF